MQKEKTKRALLLLAHPDPESFNYTIAQKVTEILEGDGWSLERVDLYQSGFLPVLSLDEIRSWQESQLNLEIESEQRRIERSDLILLVSPLWWGHFPAILKGYLDRVLTRGFAFEREGGRLFGELRDKKVLNIQTVGNLAESAQEAEALEETARHYENSLFAPCGLKGKTLLLDGIPSLGDVHYQKTLILIEKELLSLIQS